MKQKLVILHELANRGVDNAIAYYRRTDEKAALSFIDALERAYKQIRRHPNSGSARYA
jgi:toxin ParE1/3/4